MECIILAGGLGTRLRPSIGDQPKAMAEVNGRPFLFYLFDYLEQQGCTRVILSLGYKHEDVINKLSKGSWRFEINNVIEEEPLGTGGGIQLAIKEAKAADVIVLNGDTLFLTDLKALTNFHKGRKAEATLALKTMHRFDRYGSVKTDQKDCIVSFQEKSYRLSGMINGGIYIINKKQFTAHGLPEKFSFEKDYLEAFVNSKRFYGMKAEDYFIDIGVPEDYQQAQKDFKKLFK